MESKKNIDKLDELFRTKLDSYESPVGEGVWERLQQAQQPVRTKRISLYRWLVAAATAGICLGAGFWIYSKQEAPAKVTLAVSPVVVQEEVEPDVISKVTAEDSRKDFPVNVSIPAKQLKEPQSRVADTKSSAVVSETERTNTIAVAAAEIETAPADSGKNSSQATQNGGTRVLVVYVTPVLAEETALTEQPAKPEEGITAETSTEPVTVRKKKGIQRFFRQLRNAKTGEKVDWEELGISPQRTFANVESQAGKGEVQYRTQEVRKSN